MPYASVKDLPQHIKKYPARVQRMWLAVWNSTYKKTSSEKRAFMAANSVLKKNMEKFGPSHYGYDGYFMHLTDNFLGNLEG